MNHLKEGRHWLELLNTPSIKPYGYGLLLLLPVDGYAHFARKTSDSVWNFFLQNIPNISRRVTDLALALQPLAESLQSQGMGNVDSPMLGYELRLPTNLHDVSRREFHACLASYPDLEINKALELIKARKRTDNPDNIPTLIRQNWRQNNQRDAHFLQTRANNLRHSSQRQITTLERQANLKLSLCARNRNPSENAVNMEESEDERGLTVDEDVGDAGEWSSFVDDGDMVDETAENV